jgi:hypothetical protein
VAKTQLFADKPITFGSLFVPEITIVDPQQKTEAEASVF